MVEIEDYYRVVANGRIAERISDELLDATYVLSTFPKRFERLPPALTAGRDIRRRPVGHQLLIYRVDEEEARVVVLGYFDARRAPWQLDSMVRQRGAKQP